MDRSDILIGQTDPRWRGPAYQYIRVSDALPSTSAAARADDPLCTVHLFSPSGDWWVAGFDPATGVGYGVVRLFATEDGDFDINELVEARMPPFKLPIERDLYFKPKRLSELLALGVTPSFTPPYKPAPEPEPVRESTAKYAVYSRAKGKRTHELLGASFSYSDAREWRRQAWKLGAPDVDILQVAPDAELNKAEPSAGWERRMRVLKDGNAARFEIEAAAIVSLHPEGGRDITCGHEEGLALAIERAWYAFAPVGSYVFRTASFALLSPDEPKYGCSLNLPLKSTAA